MRGVCGGDRPCRANELLQRVIMYGQPTNKLTRREALSTVQIPIESRLDSLKSVNAVIEKKSGVIETEARRSKRVENVNRIAALKIQAIQLSYLVEVSTVAFKLRQSSTESFQQTLFNLVRKERSELDEETIVFEQEKQDQSDMNSLERKVLILREERLICAA